MEFLHLIKHPPLSEIAEHLVDGSSDTFIGMPYDSDVAKGSPDLIKHIEMTPEEVQPLRRLGAFVIRGTTKAQETAFVFVMPAEESISLGAIIVT